MKKLFVLFITAMFSLSMANAGESVSIPCKKIKAAQTVVQPETVEYDSETGYDFTGKGKPRYYDPMYSNYYMADPKYNQFYNYPAFYLPSVRKGGGK